MKTEINKNGEITVTQTVVLNDENRRLLVKQAVTSYGHYTGEECHDR